MKTRLIRMLKLRTVFTTNIAQVKADGSQFPVKGEIFSH